MSVKITHLVFDLGGVIVELRGAPILNEWTKSNDTPDVLWEKWLTSNAPRAFESGNINKDTFASMIVEELSLSITSNEFMDYFTSLPIGPYTGARELLSALKPRYTTALFSNSNVIHWERKMNEMKLGPLFDYHFASHLMGKVKPDIEAFEEVVSTLSVSPSTILFLDDNQLNIDAAQKVGMHAKRVVGFDNLLSALAEYDVRVE